MIYADYNATTPCLPDIADRMRDLLCTEYANPGNRASPSGRRARAAIDTARRQLAGAVHAHPDELIFTSGATEACNTVMLGVMQRLLRDRPGLLASATEHPAVLMPGRYCGEAGAEWTELPVDSRGRLDLDALDRALAQPVALVCVMAANNETGVLQDLDAIVRLAHAAGALVFSDMTQALGKIPVDLHTLGVDFACFSAHKCYGPKGVGALYKRRGLSLPPLLRGGGQEEGLRSGTENVPAIAGFGMAAERAADEQPDRAAHLAHLSRLLESKVENQLPGVVLQGAKAPRMPGTSMFSHPGLRGKWLPQLADIEAGSGSACASMHGRPSHVLQAMGTDPDTAARSVRVSLGLPTTEADVHHIADRLVAGARKLLA